MTKTNSYQRAKARVKELEEQLRISNSINEHYYQHLNISNADITELIEENAKLKDQLEASKDMVKLFTCVFIVESIIIAFLITSG